MCLVRRDGRTSSSSITLLIATEPAPAWMVGNTVRSLRLVPLFGPVKVFCLRHSRRREGSVQRNVWLFSFAPPPHPSQRPRSPQFTRKATFASGLQVLRSAFPFQGQSVQRSE